MCCEKSHVNRELTQTLLQKQILSLLLVPCSFVFHKAFPWIKHKAACLQLLSIGKTEGRALKAKVTAEEQADIHFTATLLGCFCAFTSQFPPDQRAGSTACIIHEARISDSTSGSESWGVVGRLWCLLALNGPKKALPLIAHTSFKPLLRAELKNCSFLTSFTRWVPFIIIPWKKSPQLAYVGPKEASRGQDWYQPGEE